ncbi:UNKNOWN [Stylonychia lemnae]|uniref:Uncharacterized protein n=1 Tax=Stylonychia lemnae TaxID=5949 RepID=A0A078AS25_STYLE|nr:UNKNOWN [Stylonychia lemnae]|eukprot:CDW84007.1 UNKNOWN [Stylonychia lemnae]
MNENKNSESIVAQGRNYSTLPKQFSLPKLPDLSPMPILYELSLPSTSRNQKPAVFIKRKSSMVHLKMPSVVNIKKDGNQSQILQTSFDDTKDHIIKKQNRLTMNKKYNEICLNMYNVENGDLIQAFDQIRQRIKASNKYLQKSASQLLYSMSGRQPIAQTNTSTVLSNEKMIQDLHTTQYKQDQKSLDDQLDKLFITQNQTQDPNMTAQSIFPNNMTQTQTTIEKCRYCTHCLIKDGQSEKLTSILKRSLSNDTDFMFLESEDLIQRIESSSRLMQAFFEKKPLPRKDLIFLDNLIMGMISDNVQAEKIIDQELVDKIKSNWLYRGLSCTKETEHTLNELQNDELGAEWIQGKIMNWMEDDEINRKINDSYKKYYLKYHGHNLKKKQTYHYFGNNNPGKFGTKRRSQSLNQSGDVERKDVNQSVLDEYFKNKFKSLKEKVEDKKQKKGIVDDFDRRAAIAFIGFLMLKLVKQFLLINEEQWIKRIKKLKNQIQRLHNDRDFLLAKATKPLQTLDLKKVVTNDKVDAENLAEHKRVINQMVGLLHKVEDEKYFQDFKLKYAEQDIKDWMYEWDKIKIYEDLKLQVQNIDPLPILQKHQNKNAIEPMSKHAMLLLVNAERFIQAIGYKTRWEVELDRIQDLLVKMKNEQFVLQKETQSFRDAYRHMELVSTTKEQEIMNLNYINIKLQRELALKQTANKEVMTEVDMKNLDFISKAENVFKSKTDDIKDFIKCLQKVKFNQSKQEAMPLKEIVDLVQLVFTKKQQQMAEIKFGEGMEVSFEEFLHQVMVQRFGFKKKIKQKTEQFLLGINKYAKNDERFDLIAKILVLDDSEVKYPKEILNTFIKILNSTDENFKSLLSDDADSIMIETKKAIKATQDIFQNANQLLKTSLRKEILFESEIIIDGSTKMDANLQQKVKNSIKLKPDQIEVYVLLQFWQKITHQFAESLIQVLQEKAESLENGLLDVTVLKDLFWSMTDPNDRNLMFGYENRVPSFEEELQDFRKYLTKYFSKELQKVFEKEYLPTKRLKQFLRHKYEIKVCVRNFLKKGLNFSLQMLDYCRFFLKRIYHTFDINQNGNMDLAITNSIDYERKEINFEQFVNCAMSHPLMRGILEATDIDAEIQKKRLGHLKK